MSTAEKFQVAVVGATFETNNMGVSALAAATVKCILSQHPEADIFFLDYSKTSSVRTLKIEGKEVSVRLVNLRFSKKFYLPNNIAFLMMIALAVKLVPFKLGREWIVAHNQYLSKIQGATLVASLAGGDSFSDIYGMGRFLYVSLPQILVLWLGKRLVLLPQTIGPFQRKASRAMARYILQRAEHIYSREFRSLPQLERLVGCSPGSGKLTFGYDVGFVLDAIPADRVIFDGIRSLNDPSRTTVGLNVSGLLYMGGYTRKNMFGLRANYRELISGIVDFLVVRKNANVLLIPHVFGADHESDEGPSARIYELLHEKYKGHLGLLRGKYNQHEIKHVIGGCDFVIGSRMHACIAAVSQGVPAVCIAYSDKFMGVMETLGIDSLVIDARRLGADEILETIDRAYEQRTIVRQKLASKMPEVRRAVLSLFASINRSLGACAGWDQEVDWTGVEK
jgi:colanic acid/amylovoran biosynthesis protein